MSFKVKFGLNPKNSFRKKRLTLNTQSSRHRIENTKQAHTVKLGHV